MFQPMGESRRIARIRAKGSSCRLEREEWNKMLAEYRNATSAAESDVHARWSHAAIARKFNCDPRTCQRAYEVGWTAPQWATRAIKDILRDERLAARAALAETDDELKAKAERLRDERDLAKLDAVAEAAREAQAVRSTIQASLSLLANLALLSGASQDVARAAAKSIRAAANAGTLSQSDAMTFLGQFSRLAHQGSRQLETAMRTLRKHLGAPEEVIGLTTAHGPVTLVDGRAAIEGLGEDQLKQAIKDLADGQMTDAVDKLITFQVDRAELAERASVRPIPN
jgi:hypothetical protein